MFRIESLLSARLFLRPQRVGDRIFFESNMSGHISLYAMDYGGSVPEPLLPPDIVLHNPIVPGQPFPTVKAVYDIKSPCPPGSNSPHWDKNQGADYMSMFGVCPKLVSPGNIIVTGALGSSAGATALRAAARLLRIPIPWP